MVTVRTSEIRMTNITRRTHKNWISVASAEHVRIGRTSGFMQVSHGKAAPLRRISPGDRIAYYSPSEAFGGKDRLQAFTAIGVVKRGEPYQVDMGGGFRPYRRDVLWSEVVETPIRSLLGLLSFTRDKANWGYQLRFGLFEITEEDMRVIRQATSVMRVASVA
jgi:EVE domain